MSDKNTTDNTSGNATVNGDNIKAEEETGGGQTVPYSRFQEVNARRKAAEDTLNGIVEELCQDVPEDMRGLIPNLPAAEKVKWLRDARKQGLFKAHSGGTSGPDATRPIAKPSEDFNTLSPVAMMARGYNK